MVNDIKSAISIAITKLFEEGYKVYIENIEQGMKTPCFFIKCLSPSRKKLTGLYSEDVFDFDVHYFPSSDEPKAENDDVGYRLLDCLSTIVTTNGIGFVGNNMSYSTVDDVLHFLVSYKCMRREVITPSDLMEIMSSEIKEK